jgi:hypothetical protein
LVIFSAGQNGFARFEGAELVEQPLERIRFAWHLADDLTSRLVVPQAEIHRMAEFLVRRPLGEADLCHEIRCDPVRRLVGLDPFGKRGLIDRARLQQLRHARQLVRVESGASVADVLQSVPFLHAEQERSEVLACLPRFGPTANHEFLFVVQLNLAPRRRPAAGLIGGRGVLDNQPFPAFLHRSRVQRRRIVRDLLAEPEDSARLLLVVHQPLEEVLESAPASG